MNARELTSLSNALASFPFENPILDPSAKLDDPERLKYLSSNWTSFFNPRKKARLNEQMESLIKTLFTERYNFKNKDYFTHVWDKIVTAIWTTKDPVTIDVLQKIDRAFKDQLVYHGPGITAPLNTPETSKHIQTLINTLLHGDRLSKEILTSKAFNAVLIDHESHDSELVNCFFNELKRELIDMANKVPKTVSEELLWRAYTGNIIALLPFCYPKKEHDLQLPILSKDTNNVYTCQLVDYEIEEIDLHLTNYCTPMKCLGLTAKNGNADPILVFIGTTYPGGYGFGTSLLADFPYDSTKSVGEAVYDQNYDVIDGWLKDKTNVHAVGISLGGALALLASKKHGSHFSKISAYSPPGLVPEFWDKTINKNCSINIWSQDGDFITQVGAWPTDSNVSLYLAIPHEEHLKSKLSSHARVFYGCKDVSIIKLDPEKENRDPSRISLTKLHRRFSWILHLTVKFFLWISYVAGLFGQYLKNLTK